MIHYIIHESNHGDKLSFPYNEFNSDYATKYNGLIVEIDMSQEELRNYCDLPCDSSLADRKGKALFLAGAITYKQKELHCKSKAKFLKYNEDIAGDYLMQLKEKEAFNLVHFNIKSHILDKLSAKRGIEIHELVIAIMKRSEAHKNLIVDYSDKIDELSSKVNSLTINELYDLSIDDELVKILTPCNQESVEVSYDDTMAANMRIMQVILEDFVSSREITKSKKKATKAKNFDGIHGISKSDSLTKIAQGLKS